MTDTDWVIVRPDGIDWDVECGLCGWTCRSVAATEDKARVVAAQHAAECPEHQREQHPE